MKTGTVVKIIETTPMYPTVFAGDFGMICSEGKVAADENDPIYGVLIGGQILAFFPNEFVIVPCKSPKIVV